MTTSSECYGDIAAFLGGFQLCCFALVLAGRDVVVVAMRGGDVVVVMVFQWWWW